MGTAADCAIDPRRLRHLGSGVYNDVYEIVDRPDVVLRLSYFNEDVLSRVISLKENLKRAIRQKVASHIQRYTQAIKNHIDEDPITVESKIMDITNALIARKVSPHYVEKFSSMECRGFFDRMRAQKKIPKKRLESSNKNATGQKYNYNSISIVRRYSSDITTFVKTMRMTDQILAVVIFQVMYSLAALQRYISNFRHNDLSTNNVFISVDDKPPKNIEYAAYTIGKSDTVYLPCIGVHAALADYDFASGGKVRVPGMESLSPIRNVKVKVGGWANTDEWFINPIEHKSYDAQYFLYSLEHSLPAHKAKRSLFTRRNTDPIPKTRAFLKRVMNASNKRFRSGTRFPALYPLNILKDPYFDAFRVPKEPVVARYDLRNLDV